VVGGPGSAEVVAATASTSTSDWITALGTVTATLTAVILGLGVKDWWLRPRLVPKVRQGSDASLLLIGAVRIPGIGAAPMLDRAMYLRLYIANEGRSSAAKARVPLLRVEVWSRDQNRWEEYKHELEGQEFNWSGSEPRATERQLAKKSQ
jgi:hypothetical protein